jgi:tetratricopeptide (TPR) repeat protein
MTRRACGLAALALLLASGARSEIRNEPGHASAVYRAWLEYSLGEDDSALARLEALLGETSFVALEEAMLAGRHQERARMLERAERALELDPDNGEAAALLARLWFRIADEGTGHVALAPGPGSRPVDDPLARGMERADAAVRLGTADAEIFDRLAAAHALLATRLESAGDAAGAAAHVAQQRQVLETWASRLHQELAWQRLADLARELQDGEGEARALSRLLQSDPGSSLLALAYAEAMRDLGRGEAAIPALQRALAGDEVDKYSASSLQVRLGECALDGDDAELAETSLRAALEMDPTNLIAATGLADATWDLGRRDEAVQFLQDFGTRLGGTSGEASGGVSERLDYLVTRARWKSRHDLPEAVDDARRALAVAESGANARQRAAVGALLADVLASDGDLDGAVAAAKAALTADPGQDSALMALLNATWLAGDRRAVEDEIARAERRGKHAAGWFERLAAWEAARGLDDAARRHVGEALAADEGSSVDRTMLQLRLAGALLDAGAADEAERLAREVVARRPYDVDAAFTEAATLVELGRTDEAMRQVDELVAARPPDPFLEERRAAWLSRLRRHDEALAAMARAVALVGSDAPRAVLARFHAVTGDLALAGGRLAESVRAFEAAQATGILGGPARDLDHSEALDRLSRTPEALALIDAAIARHPGHAGLRIEKARLLLKLSRTPEALALLDSAIAAEAAVPGRHGQVAILLAENGQVARAREVIEAAVARFPRHAGTKLAAARVAEKAGDVDGAIAFTRDALALDPDAPVMLNALGYVLADAGRDLDEAVKLLRRAVEKRPNEAAYLDSLGWARLKQGEVDDGMRLLEQAVARDRDPVVLMHLATARESAGRTAEALALYREALDAGLDEDVARVTQRVQELEARAGAHP